MGCLGYSDPPACTQTCSPRFFGANCSQNCNTSCFYQLCDPFIGNCLNCSVGRYGNQCDVCPDNYFGLNCSEKCSDRCTSQMCNSVSGRCESCVAGYHRELCDRSCGPKYFGRNCSQRCNRSCADELCHPVDGRCIRCPIGKNGINCDDCPFGTYGEDCQQQCSVHCLNHTCDIVNGTCKYGCETGYTGLVCLVFSAASQGTEAGDFVGVIVGSVVGALVLMAVFIIAKFIMRRQKVPKLMNKQSPQRQTDGSRMSLNSVNSFHSIHEGKSSVIPNSNEKQLSKVAGTYVNTAPQFTDNTSIVIDNLYSFIKTHSEEYFTQQFESLPQTPNVTTDAGSHDENRIKNRFKNIYPYDHSRVHLKTNFKKSEKDYINASYIKGFENNVKFIGTQGPNNITLNDFVRMLWEQNIEIVIMLTNLIEDGKVKCEKYWPDGDEKKDQPTHLLTQFHFTSWPDKSVPIAAWSLVDFEQRVFSCSTSEPIVVHCSAGVGRTGTFITLHNVIKESEKTGRADFFNTVMKLRQDRMQMFQTAEQYEFLHKAALAANVCMGTTFPVNNLVYRLTLLDEQKFASQSKIDFEFKAICNACETNHHKTKESPVNENDKNLYESTERDATSFKNRFSVIIPSDTYRPHLTCYNSEVGDYINAVILPSYKHIDQQFLTQLPMPSTVTDFWRLVTQYNITVLVAFELDTMLEDKTFGQYLPLDEEHELLCHLL
ncbi:hypothetical protein Btru_067841 [Bulinus truncatus]|nr:hypothetical protein Btru_067841 [Bulinus truncatus]